MSNQAEVDYDKQFQDDLAKATALSLEQQALDDYRRHKKYGTAYHYERATRGGSGAASRDYSASLQSQQQLHGNTSERPLPGHPQRRHSEVHQVTMRGSSKERSSTPPAHIPTESDLICFASPTSKQPENSNTFEKLIEDLQKMQTTNPQTALVPLGPVAAAPAHYVPVSYQPYSAPQCGSVVGASSMQIVPFQPPLQQRQVPLTNEELQRLYSMPNHLSHGHPQIGFVPPSHTSGYGYKYVAAAPPYTAPIVNSSAAYLPPQYPPQGYGYTPPALRASYAPGSVGSTHVDFSRPHGSPSTGSIDHRSHSTLHSNDAVTNGGYTPSSSIDNTRRQTSPISSSGLPAQRSANDLIDLNQDDDSRVSVLDAFDPLLNENTVSQK